MAQLSVSFDIDADVKEAINALPSDATRRAVALHIASEKLVGVALNIPASASLDDDLRRIREAVREHPCCYIFIRGEGGSVSLISVVPDAQPPKTKMLYAAATKNLRSAVSTPVVREVHLTSLDDLNAKVFEKEGREGLMTESEKINAALAQLPVAPMGSALPGLALSADPSAESAVTKFVEGSVASATFSISNGTAVCEWSSADANISELKKQFGAQPRFALLKWHERSLLLYICPVASKPRDRMAYSASKAGFLAYLTKQGVANAKSIEMDGENVEESIDEALKGGVDMQPVAPKAVVAKGPRMVLN